MSIELRRIRVCALEEIPPEEGRVVRIADRPIAIFRSGESVHALDNTCTHMGGPLADGLVADATVACPLHERRFDLATGRAVGHDCGAVGAYPVDVVDGEVLITVPVLRDPAGAGVTLGTFAAAEVSLGPDLGPDESSLEAEMAAEADLVSEEPHPA